MRPLMGLILILLGIFNMAAPEAAWYLEYGWRFRDAEPSEAALLFARIGGGFAIVIGLFCLFTR